MQNRGVNNTPTFRSLFPQIPEDQVEEAEANFERYIRVTLRIYERLQQDPDAWSQFLTLTQLGTELYDETAHLESKDTINTSPHS